MFSTFCLLQNAIQLNDPNVLSDLETSNAYITHFKMNYTREMQHYLPLSGDYQVNNDARELFLT